MLMVDVHASGRTEFDITSMLATELAPVATSMFNDKGQNGYISRKQCVS